MNETGIDGEVAVVEHHGAGNAVAEQVAGAAVASILCDGMDRNPVEDIICVANGGSLLPREGLALKEYLGDIEKNIIEVFPGLQVMGVDDQGESHSRSFRPALTGPTRGWETLDPQLFAELIRSIKSMPDHAVMRIVREVRDGSWPDDAHSFH